MNWRRWCRCNDSHGADLRELMRTRQLMRTTANLPIGIENGENISSHMDGVQFYAPLDAGYAPTDGMMDHAQLAMDERAMDITMRPGSF